MSAPRRTACAQAPDLADALQVIRRSRAGVPAGRAVLVGVSGIDGSGKGFVGRQLVQELTARGRTVALIGADALQNPLTLRLSEVRPTRHFYDHVFRWRELFEQIVDPLVAHRSLDVVVNAIRPDVDEYYPLRYRFDRVDIVVLEGIFLFKRELAGRFDVRLWVECSFATALERAHARNQEGQPPDVIERDYRRIYHAAQRLHFALDQPRARAHAVVVNDPLLLAGPSGPEARLQAAAETT
jgi:uridine kinase